MRCRVYSSFCRAAFILLAFPETDLDFVSATDKKSVSQFRDGWHWPNSVSVFLPEDRLPLLSLSMKKRRVL